MKRRFFKRQHQDSKVSLQIKFDHRINDGICKQKLKTKINDERIISICRLCFIIFWRMSVLNCLNFLAVETLKSIVSSRKNQMAIKQRIFASILWLFWWLGLRFASKAERRRWRVGRRGSGRWARPGYLAALCESAVQATTCPWGYRGRCGRACRCWDGRSSS